MAQIVNRAVLNTSDDRYSYFGHILKLWKCLYIELFPHFQKMTKSRNVETFPYRDISAFSKKGQIGVSIIISMLHSPTDNARAIEMSSTVETSME